MKIILTKKEVKSCESLLNTIHNQIRKTELCIEGKTRTLRIPKHINEESVIDFNYMYKGIANIKIERNYIVFTINENLMVDSINTSKEFITAGFDVIRYAYYTFKSLIANKMRKFI